MTYDLKANDMTNQKKCKDNMNEQQKVDAAIEKYRIDRLKRENMIKHQ